MRNGHEKQQKGREQKNRSKVQTTNNTRIKATLKAQRALQEKLNEAHKKKQRKSGSNKSKAATQASDSESYRDSGEVNDSEDDDAINNMEEYWEVDLDTE